MSSTGSSYWTLPHCTRTTGQSIDVNAFFYMFQYIVDFSKPSAKAPLPCLLHSQFLSVVFFHNASAEISELNEEMAVKKILLGRHSCSLNEHPNIYNIL